VTAAAVWNMPLPYRSEDPEPALCLSHLYTPPGGQRLGPLVCIFDAGHPDSGGPGSLHCGGSEELPTWWTDEAAALSAAVYRASAAVSGPVCKECEIRPQSAGGRCRYCVDVEAAMDRLKAESEADAA
jgi:hypothetical protein